MAEVGRNINKAFQAGCDNQEAGGGLAGNPYKAGSPSWKAWRKGWCASWKERPGGVEWTKKYGHANG